MNFSSYASWGMTKNLYWLKNTEQSGFAANYLILRDDLFLCPTLFTFLSELKLTGIFQVQATHKLERFSIHKSGHLLKPSV